MTPAPTVSPANPVSPAHPVSPAPASLAAANPPAIPTRPNLLMRNDTMLGICQALGDDLGFPPNLLRIALSLAFYLNPPLVVAAYLGLGLVVALSRWVAPPRFDLLAAPIACDDAPLGEENEALRLAA